MFERRPSAVQDRMQYLEQLDAEHRRVGMDHFKRLRQVPPETGRFLALLAAGAPEGSYLEIGTSGGYSGLWLALACRETGRKMVTFEVAGEKVKLARETFNLAGVDDVIEIVEGDAREHLGDYQSISFCFLDAEKKHYQDCYDSLIPNMVPGGLLVADNVISHKEILQDFVDGALSDPRVDALVVPIGSGLLLCRRVQDPP